MIKSYSFIEKMNMNEGYKYTAETLSNEEFLQLVEHNKIDLLNRLVVANSSLDPESNDISRVGVTHIEIMALTPHEQQDAVLMALHSLKSDNHIRETCYNPYQTSGVFVGYELTADIPARLPLAVSAQGAIREVFNYLEKRREQYGIGSLSAEEWALLPILDTALTGILCGDLEVDLAKIHRKILDDLHDETVEKWHLAFANAVQRAQILVQPHPESR